MAHSFLGATLAKEYLKVACILVIEDDDSFRLMLRRRLEKANHDVMEAANGKAGIKVTKEKLPDLIIID